MRQHWRQRLSACWQKTNIHPIDGKGVISNKKLLCVLPLELLPVLHRRVARGLAEALDKIVHRVEGQGFRDLLHRRIRGGEQHFCPLHFGEADITVDGLAGLFLEFIRQVILDISHQRGQIGNTDLPVQTQFDVIAAFLDGERVIGVCPQMMDPIDEIVIHREGQGAEFPRIPTVLRGLDCQAHSCRPNYKQKNRLQIKLK